MHLTDVIVYKAFGDPNRIRILKISESRISTAGRMPMLQDLNFRLTYDMAQLLGGAVHPQVIVGVLHVASQKKATLVDQVHYFSQDANGNPADPNPYHLNLTRFPQPMSLRVGVEVNF